MLNELIQAAKGIPELPSTLHKELKTLPKSPAYKVLLAADGSVADVQSWAEDISCLRKWQPGGNGVSFPVFNIKPLFAPDLDDEMQKILERIDPAIWPVTFQKIETCCKDSALTLCDKKRNNGLNESYQKSLVDVPNQLLEAMKGYQQPHPVLSQLLTRLTGKPAGHFFLSLIDWLENQLRNAHDEQLFKLYCAISSAEAEKKFNILLDIPDWDDIGSHPVTSTETAIFINSLLAARDATGDGTLSPAASSPDAYGQPANQAGEKFDDIIVGGLGKIILRAMTRDAPCQYRYGKADADSFVVGTDSRRQAKSALEFLARPDAKGKTWQFRGGNLILIYPERDLPELSDLDAADICSLPEEDNDQTDMTATFVARAERIAKTFDGKPNESAVPVHLIILRKPDGHRTKVAAHHFFTMSHLIESARRWTVGARGCPPIAFSRWGKEKGKRNDIVPDVPFPGEVVNWLNTYWVRSGESQGKLSTFCLEDALSLLLANGGSEKPLATHALRQAIANWSGFLVAHGTNQRSAVILKATDKRSSSLRCLPAILSLLLHKLGHTKEQLMSSPAFLIGRLLALADSLHFQYCLGVRNGSTPPQLLGNALMQTALETPQSALALYAQRILPYQAWAKTCTAPEGFSPERLAKSLLGQLSDVCAEVALTDIPERGSDADKAQMILGYLAKTKSND